MRTTDVELILETYDEAINKRKAILSIAKLLDVTPEEVIEKLQQNGRKIDYTKKEKPKKAPAKVKDPEPRLIKNDESKDPEGRLLKTEEQKQPEAAAAKAIIPDYVQDVLFREFGALETRLGELQAEIEATEQKYKLLKNYLFG